MPLPLPSRLEKKDKAPLGPLIFSLVWHVLVLCSVGGQSNSKASQEVGFAESMACVCVYS